MKKLLALLVFGAGILASTFSVHAHPYASGVTNNAGTIQFYLNEIPTSAYVIFEDGSSTNITSPVVGVNSFPLGTNTCYSIYVYKAGTGVPAQISSDASPYSAYPSPRGVAVNYTPK